MKTLCLVLAALYYFDVTPVNADRVISATLPPLLQKFHPIQRCLMVVVEPARRREFRIVGGIPRIVYKIVKIRKEFCCKGWQNKPIGVSRYDGRPHKCSVFTGNVNSTYLTTDRYEKFMTSFSTLRSNMKNVRKNFQPLMVLNELKAKADALKSRLLEQQRRIGFLLNNFNVTSSGFSA